MAVAKTATAVAKPVAKAISAIKLVEEPVVTVTKETATTSKVKTTPGNKTTEQKETEVKKEVKTETAVKKEAVKKQTAKKETAVKKEPVKKTASKKETVKKAAVSTTKKEPVTKESVKKEIVHLQFEGKSYTLEQLVKIAKDVWVHDLERKLGDFKEVELYVKPEESLAYYVINKTETGSFAI